MDARVARYAAKFTDAHGTEETVISNDGEYLRMTVRGVDFESDQCFEDFEPVKGTPPEVAAQFPRFLRPCQIECEIPVFVVDGDDEVESVVRCEVNLTSDHSDWFRFTLTHRGEVYTTSGGSFEDLGRPTTYVRRDGVVVPQTPNWLPDDAYVKACVNCLFSDYSPYGNSSFGSMACYREGKAEYLAARGKLGVMELRIKEVHGVQEIHLCDEFELRVPGTGYRG